jgi:hypothetical protein
MKNLFLILALLIGAQSQAAIVTNTISNFRFSAFFNSGDIWVAPAGVTEVVLLGSGGSAGGGGGGGCAGPAYGASIGGVGGNATGLYLDNLSISGSSFLSIKKLSTTGSAGGSNGAGGTSGAGGTAGGLISYFQRVKVIPGNSYTVVLGAGGAGGAGGAAGGGGGNPALPQPGSSGGVGGSTTFTSGAVVRTFPGVGTPGTGGTAGSGAGGSSGGATGGAGATGNSGFLMAFWDAPALP